MCGINGFTWADKDLIKKMNDKIAYRGPDDHGAYVDDHISLGHRRLSIIDLSKKGAQPMGNAEGDVVIVYNGEVYNYLELRKELEKKYRFVSDSDTEVILHAYEEWGEECLKKFNGMFAIAIWDKNNRSLFLARDRLGIKPLYYAFVGKEIIFSSEIKSLLMFNELKREVNVTALSSYLTYRFITSNDTMIKDIKKIPPGHYMVFTHDEIVVKRYWDLSWDQQEENEQTIVENVRKHVTDAVKRRLRSDVPLGAYLSGGLDSSIIVSANAQLRDDPVKTFTIGFGEETDEFKYAKAVAQHLNTDHNELVLEYQKATKLLPKIIYHMDEPSSDITQVPLFFLSHFSKKKVTVINTGEGADELFGGYYHYMAGAPRYNWIPESMRKKTYLWYYSPFKDALRNDVLTLKVPKDESLKATLAREQPKELLNKILLFDMKKELPNWQLARVDRMTMAHAQEARVPFLDHEVVEYASRIPVSMKIKGKNMKYVLRKAFSDSLPKVTLTRKKQGFTTPMFSWLKKDLEPLAEQVLSQENMKKRPYLNTNAVQKIVNRHKQLKKPKPFDRTSYQLLILLGLELWTQMYIDEKKLSF